MRTIASPKLVLNYLDPAEDGSTHAIFAAAPGDHVDNKPFSAATAKLDVHLTFDANHAPLPELVVGQTYTFAISVE
jgi:hypothetical protein